MSYVVAIKRPADQPPLSAGDVEQLLETDRSLVSENGQLII